MRLITSIRKPADTDIISQRNTSGRAGWKRLGPVATMRSRSLGRRLGKRERNCPLPGTKSVCLGRNQAARSGPATPWPLGNTVSAVVDPGTARLDELAGRDHRGMAKDRDQVALAARLDPQHAVLVLLVVERDALYQASQGLGRGIFAGWQHHGGDLILSATCRACEPRHRPVPLGSRLWPPIQGRPLATPSFRRVRAARSE